MQELFGSVRKSLVFRPNPTPGSSDDPPAPGITEKIGSCLRKSRVGLGLGFLQRPLPPPPIKEESAPSVRWRKGELIGCGAFGHVYMGMNLDSGELLAVKQVLIGANSSSKEKAQAHIRELEEEVNLLKNLSHPNIVRYLGTSREEGTLNILLEFVPGGSISSLLGKLGSFPEPVIRKYTRQLLQGLEYLHHNKIIHRDIKGANILVDNKGHIKLADFGASKQVAKLATMTAAKSMKGTPYWMAPEVIVQSGHSFSADIWSVACTVIEMATGKPPWSQQYQEVAALFHVGTTKSHPPIPEHLSSEAKDFLLKCLHEEPNLRPTASDLLQHPFIAEEYQDSHPLHRSSAAESSSSMYQTPKSHMINNLGSINRPLTSSGGLRNADYGDGSCSTISHEKHLGGRPLWGSSDSGDVCRFADEDDFPVVGSSFNPMSEPFDDWSCKFDVIPDQRMDLEDSGEPIRNASDSAGKGENDFSFPCDVLREDDNEDTEIKITAFLEEKALDLKKLMTPLYEEFLNTSNPLSISSGVGNMCKENITSSAKLPPIIKRSPSKVVSGASTPSHAETLNHNMSSGNCSRRVSIVEVESSQILSEIPSPSLNKQGELLQDPKQKPNNSPSASNVSFSERQRKWKEELVQELAREREMMRQAGVVGGKASSSPKDNRGLNRKRDRMRLT